jgi:hypothetical protein
MARKNNKTRKNNKINNDRADKESPKHDNSYLGCFLVPLLGWIGLSTYVLFLCLPWWGAILLGIIVGFIFFAMTGISGSNGSVTDIGTGATLYLVFALIFVLNMRPIFLQARDKARGISCLSNLKRISYALQLYANDHEGHLPSVKYWRGAILPYLIPQERESIFSCPSNKANKNEGDEKDEHDYVMNPKVSRADFSRLSAQTPIVYESAPKRHQGKYWVLFASGQATEIDF